MENKSIGKKDLVSLGGKDYPVQKVAIDGDKVTKEEVKDAVKEINPDQSSMESRG